MARQIARVYDEALSWGHGPLDPTERAAAAAVCARATSRADAEELLAMCGLLRKPSPRQEPTP